MYNLSSSHLIESDTIGRFGAALACSDIEVPSIDRRKLPIGRTVPSLGLSTLTPRTVAAVLHCPRRIPCSGSGSQHGGADTSKRTHAHAHARTCKRARAHAHARTRPDTRARASARSGQAADRMVARALGAVGHRRSKARADRRRLHRPTDRRKERAQVRFLCAELSGSPLACAEVRYAAPFGYKHRWLSTAE